MTIRGYLSAALAIALAAASLLAWHWRGERDALRSAVSIAAHAADAMGAPILLRTPAAIAQVRVLGQAVDDARLAAAKAAAADAQLVVRVERADAQVNQEVQTHVLAELERTRDALADSRALAARRLRELAEARADPSGGRPTPAAADPDAVCGAAFAAPCDDVLALLAEAETNTAKLVGWQRWWAGVKANHDRGGDGPISAAQPLDQALPSLLGARVAAVIDGQVGAQSYAGDLAPAPAARAAEVRSAPGS